MSGFEREMKDIGFHDGKLRCKAEAMLVISVLLSNALEALQDRLYQRAWR